jgi:acylphosphatase
MRLMLKRAHVHYEGRVQGVGFRFTAVGAASPYDISGFVRNLRGGGVELVAEGEEEEIRAFLGDVSTAMKGYIRSEEVSWHDHVGEFEDFAVRYA